MSTEHALILTEAEGVLDRVELALSRLRDGSYGACLTCGEPIGDERLAEDPTTDTCSAHAP